MNLLIGEIKQRVSKFLETSLETHLNLNKNNAKMLVKEDILFGKLSETPFIKRIQDELEKIDVLLYLNNENVRQMTSMSRGTFIYYTNTNLMVELSMPIHGPFIVSVRIYTEDKQIDFTYGKFEANGNNGPEYSFGGLPHYPDPNLKKLNECIPMLHKYIHPKIYLDYYMYCASEQDMNELIHSNSLVDTINNLTISTENYKKEIFGLKQKYEIEINNKNYKIIECEMHIEELKDKNDNLNDIVETLNLDLDNIKSENECNDIIIAEEKEKNDSLQNTISKLNCEIDSIKYHNEEYSNTFKFIYILIFTIFILHIC